MKNLIPAPTVTVNTNTVIANLIGEYNKGTQYIIHAIAKNESALLKGCYSLEDYTANVETFILERGAPDLI